MKKFIATAVVALTATVAQPAMADTDDVVKGIIGVVILNEILNPNNHNRSVDVGVNGRGQVHGRVSANNYPTHSHPQTVIINNYPQRDCGFVQNVYRDHGMTRVVKTNRCTGAVMEERVIYN